MSGKDFSSVPPPKNFNQRQPYVKSHDVFAKYEDSKRSYSNNILGKRNRSNFSEEDDYFDQDDDNNTYKPSSSANDDEEEDPLDAFMADLAKSEQKTSVPKKAASFIPTQSLKNPNKEVSKGVRTDLEEEDVQESFYRYMEENPDAGVGTFADGSDAEEETNVEGVEYDLDGNPIVDTKKNINPLPVVYHSEIDYSPFVKNFYNEHDEIKKLSCQEVDRLRRSLSISVSGPQPPKVVTSFAHFGFDEQLLKVIRKLEYTQPTPIQAQAIPAALSGRDIIGIAKTGSGKTAAFVWPLLVHILDQPELKAGDGPIGLILAPTRELSQQIYTETQRFAKPYGIRVLCTYGGGSKYEQSKDLEKGAEIIVGTPVKYFF